ncbi:23S rRNA (guanosine-2'-O-)-methyltransferase RlmB [Sinobacterium norvegicum]|uniref:tRNA (cytidine/uridine-2'-O-)-methyltransferase TrmJ n=1 Tax=Sinobacterium norvegicum TaxID=1641715 RepID=A0ABN8EJS3_9GAMM|nr:tRNA/rRNA methyltransferase [Sinobacterium norvegicum]CAH0991990.1 23S rRNA (guanosine-2'-O-)-methyltransferase RlmB [Sinobacterium norvegicum]
MEIVFILSQPAVPENIGASARALKTMGFSQLRLINTTAHTDKQARILAHGSTELLRNALLFDDLGSATADCDLVIGTSAKPRHHRETLYPPTQLKELIQSQQLQRVAIVFGSEKHGLSNSELECCDILTSIPLATSYPSLNLSQAVMLYAYELSTMPLPAVDNNQYSPTTTDGQLKSLQRKLAVQAEDIGISSNDKVFVWAKEKVATLGQREIGFLHFINDKITNNKKQ